MNSLNLFVGRVGEYEHQQQASEAACNDTPENADRRIDPNGDHRPRSDHASLSFDV